jgi:hypothetical protein
MLESKASAMHKVIHGVGIAAILVLVAGASAGCSAIGYFVGGAIDGGMERALDSVSVTREADSAGLEHCSWNRERLTLLVKEASPRKGCSVEVLTQKGSFKGDALIVDTVLAVKAEPPDTGSEGFLPGELVTMTIRDRDLTQVRGRVLGPGKRTILLWADQNDRRHAPDSANAFLRSDNGVLSNRDLALPTFSGRLIRVPGLVLGQDSPPIFIPLGEVEQMRVVRPARWGTARTIGFVIGAALDIAAIIAMIEAASALSSLGHIGGL